MTKPESPRLRVSPSPHLRVSLSPRLHLGARDLDWTLLIISLVICGVGVLQIFSATRGTGWQDAWWKQIIYILVGVVLIWLTIIIDYHTLLRYVFILYGLSVIALFAVLLVGRQAFGSRRWIPVAGGFHLRRPFGLQRLGRLAPFRSSSCR